MVSRAGKGSLSTMALSCSQAKSWVKTHYERNDDGVVAKSVMYKHYEEYCREQGRNIMETSIFGRVVKSVFPDVTIRRLGGRDNLKYYYCGIWAKEESPYAIDNSTTTRPKRRLRKRELVTNKTEVHKCLLWLHANYVAANDASVVKTDVYERYAIFCKQNALEPLSIQDFGRVVTHAFPNVTKRKLGPRTNQQKFYFGIQNLPSPMSVDHVSCEYLSTIEDVLCNGRAPCRESLENAEELEDEEYCRSPESDMSDISSQHSIHTVAYEHDIRTSPQMQQCHFDLVKEENEPVDYSLSSLRLKDEPREEYDLNIKEECRTPDRPPSVGAFANNSLPSPSSSLPSPPTKEARARRIYKPRFHYNDESLWNNESPDDKRDNNDLISSDNLESQAVSTVRSWILQNFEECKGVQLNRDQIYSLYEKYCDLLKITVFPMTFFDETMLKLFRGVVTMIHPTGKFFYDGIRVRESSRLYDSIEELCTEESQWVEEDEAHNAMELSPVDGSTSHSSPLTFEEEETTVEGFPYHFPQEEDSLSPNPDVPRDGKFYLRKWLTDNFHSVPDSCVLKADAYKHYDSYARRINQTPFEMNVFGKIVRQVFPSVSIRRLGGRLRPQYHYCGIAVRQQSPLFNYMSGKDPAQRSRKKEIATDNRSAEVVIDFLRQNYEPGKEKVIMKSLVFDNYCSLCNKINENPVTLNYFGKLVKHCFPNVEVRKFGGRSEPTWYYFGLVPKGIIQTSVSPAPSYKYNSMPNPSYREETVFNPHASSSDFHATMPNAEGITQYNMDTRHNPNRHSTSPIPISMQHTHLRQPAGHYSLGSPSSLLNSHLQASLKVSVFEEPSQHGSPSENAHFFRESMTSHSPADVFCSHSPIDQPSRVGQLFQSGPMDAIYQRETLQHVPKGVPHHIGGGQVVPSQTPPNLYMVHNVDHNMGVPVHKIVSRRPFAIQEEDEIFNMAIE